MKSESEILSEYKEADKVLVVNDNDVDLIPIEILLPSPPDITTIDGYGLPAKKQKFKKQKYPDKLIELESKGLTITEVWDLMFKERHYYHEELQWIQKQWEYRLYGYWFYNNGKPTYIDGWHFFYLNYWELDTGLPEYRDRDRKFFLFARMCYNDPLCIGFNYPKHRREGATSKASCIHYDIVSRMIRGNGGIQSMTESHAQTVFQKHIVHPFKTIPFFFKPEYEGSTDPKSVLSFQTASMRVTTKGGVIKKNNGLGSQIDYRSSEERAYDTNKLHFYHGDEAGKRKDSDVGNMHNIIRKCLAQGGKIHGFCVYTSTVGEMDSGGGMQFKRMCEASNYHKRDKNGRTTTWLFTLFIPADEGADGFIDEYGNSLKEEARAFLMNSRQAMLTDEQYDLLSEEIRMNPLKYSECFRAQQKQSGFNLYIIEKRLDELAFKDKIVKRRGNFVWMGGVQDSKVEWQDNKNGKFYVSLNLNDCDSNKKLFDSGLKSWRPLNNMLFVSGADPFKFSQTRYSEKSNAAGCVFYKRDFSIDPEGKDMRDWKSNRFVCTYDNRPMSKQEFGEDMIMMCVYYGCQINLEINVDWVLDYFRERGYIAYIMYDYDLKKEQFKSTPGVYTGAATKQAIFTELMNYVQYHGEREMHAELLSQWREIQGVNEMTKYDLFTASGMALLGANNIYNKVFEKFTKKVDVTDIFERFNY